MIELKVKHENHKCMGIMKDTLYTRGGDEVEPQSMSFVTDKNMDIELSCKGPKLVVETV